VLHAHVVQEPAPPRRARFTDARLRRFREAIGRLREVGDDEQLEHALDLVRACWRQWDGVRLQSIQGA
jgi:hypothetical protein